MRTTIDEAPSASESLPPSPLNRALASAGGALFIGGLVVFWTLLFVVNLAALPVRLVRRVLRR